MAADQKTVRAEAKAAKARAKAMRPWYRKKRWWLLIAIVAIAVIVIATSGSNSPKSPATTSDSSSTTAGSAGTTAAAPAPGPAPITLSGSGQQATQPFTAAGGLTVLHSTCTACQSNFSVEVLDASGQTTDVAANTIGAYDGSKGENLGAGTYSLKIDADAAWTVVVTQPRNQPLTPLPQTFSGKGDQFVGPFDAAHAVRIQAQNTGQSNFAVEVLDASGATQDVSFNEVGNFNGSTVSQMISRGPYFLDVTSDGQWSLQLSKP